MFIAAPALKDFFVLELETLTWRSLVTSGLEDPVSRTSHGFTSLEGKLYCHGGNDETGEAVYLSRSQLLICNTI